MPPGTDTLDKKGATRFRASAVVPEDLFLLPLCGPALDVPAQALVELDRLLVQARTDDLHRLLEVGHRDLLRALALPESNHSGLAGEAFDVRARVAIELLRKLVQVDAFQGHRLRVDLQDLQARALVRRWHEEDAVEAARAQERGIDHVGSVRRPDHDDAL